MALAIKIENASKKYIIHHEQQQKYVALRDVIASNTKRLMHSLRHPLGGREESRPGSEEFWALRDISLEVTAGERVGIVGRNGAGKSTLLKILSRITEPTKGRISLGGRVASLLEVGTGFHPELTGRENIYLNGAILGMSKAEIRRKFDDIVEFAEVARFLDTPVKRYSSGMYVRLAFAVAAHLESDILIVDEVLAVGDAGFQKKCMGRMESVANDGRTILFVSHNMGAVSELCNRAVLLDKGCLVEDGAVPDVVASYSRMADTGGQYAVTDQSSHGRECYVSEIRLLDQNGQETSSFDLNDDIGIEITYVINERMHGFQAALTLSRYMVDVLHTFTTDHGEAVEWVDAGVYRATHRLPPMFLKGGSYTLSLAIGTPNKLIQELASVVQFDVEEHTVNTLEKGFKRERPGHVISPGTWELVRVDV